jgi:hypothetical protein
LAIVPFDDVAVTEEPLTANVFAWPIAVSAIDVGDALKLGNRGEAFGVGVCVPPLPPHAERPAVSASSEKRSNDRLRTFMSNIHSVEFRWATEMV